MKKAKKTLIILATIVAAICIIVPIILIHIPQVRMMIFEQVGFIPNSIDAIFYFFCAILYGIGFILGWNYQEASVYICIYLWPVLLGLSSLPILYNAAKNLVRKKNFPSVIHFALSAGYASVFVWICKYIWSRYNQPTISGQFNKCMSDLTTHAEQLNLSYTELNILFYIVLFAIIVGVNALIANRQKHYFFLPPLKSRS